MIRLKARKVRGSTARKLVDESGAVVGEVRRSTFNAGDWMLRLEGVYWLNGEPRTTGGATGIRVGEYSDALLLAGAAYQRIKGRDPLEVGEEIHRRMEVMIKEGPSEIPVYQDPPVQDTP